MMSSAAEFRKRCGLLGLGLGRIPAPHLGGPSLPEGIDLLVAALENGISLFDTAPCYGRGLSEVALGRAIAGVPRSEVTICSKFGLWPDGSRDFRASRLEESVQLSLARLETDYLDILMLHGPDFPREVDALQSGVHAAKALQSKGLIREVGLSLGPGTSNELDAAVALGVDAVEVRYNAMAQHLRYPLLRHCGRVRVMVKQPLEGGWLADRDQFDKRRQSRWDSAEMERRIALRDRVRAATRCSSSLMEVSLAFALRFKSVSDVILGVKSLAQLQQALSLQPENVPNEILEAVHQIWTEHDQEITTW